MKTHSRVKSPINQSSQVTEKCTTSSRSGILLYSLIEICITGRGAAYLDLKIYFAPVFFLLSVWWCQCMYCMVLHFSLSILCK